MKRLRLLTLLAAVAALAFPAGAVAVTYEGLRLDVPATWKVVRLAADPTACVRFDRHALYLGVPGGRQRCPAGLVGRTDAILVEPGGVAPPAGLAVVREHGLVVAVSSNHDRALVERIIGRRLPSVTASVPRSTRALPRVAPPVRTAVMTTTGLGFDACSAPSLTTISAWSASPYRTIGVYIGGVNRACSQPNLTAAWVRAVSQAGWTLLPLYVGLQVPGACSGCSTLNASQASAEGAAAAADAVTQMQALGIGAGNPVYNDLEGYPRSAANSSAALAFLAGWTSALHTDGYVSGVYSSADSGVSDLVSQFGTTYSEPDDLWIADWNGSPSTSDAAVPAAEWASHQRVHQYKGGHNERYGGVTINIDSDAVDGAVALFGAAPPVPEIASLRVTAGIDGSISLAPSASGPALVASWQLLGGASASGMVPVGTVAAGSAPRLVTHSAFAQYQAEALDSAGQPLAFSSLTPAPARVVVYGHSAYTPLRGLGAMPVGCFTGASCRLSLTLSAGRTTVARTGSEHMGAGRSGFVYFALTPAGRRRLAAARGLRLAVRARVRDASGTVAATTLHLVGFSTSGAAPRRLARNVPRLGVIGTTAFVSGGGFGVGGVLAACAGLAPCRVRLTITAHRRVIARSGPAWIGANELGYVFFKLIPAGRRLLTATPSNMLAAHVALVNHAGSLGVPYALDASAAADVALVSVS